MKKMFAATTLLALIVSLGCSNGSTRSVAERDQSTPSAQMSSALVCEDVRLAPFNAKLAQLTTSSSPREIEAIFGISDNVPRVMSMGFESVHTLANGSTVRILSLPQDHATRWETSARFIPKNKPGEAITNRIQLEGASIALKKKDSNRVLVTD